MIDPLHAEPPARSRVRAALESARAGSVAADLMGERGREIVVDENRS